MKKETIYFVGKILLLSIFIISGILHLFNIEGSIKMIEDVNFPYPKISAYVFALFEIIVPIIIIFMTNSKKKEEKKIHNNLVVILTTYMIIITLIYNNVFADSSHKYSFIKNMSIVGGLLLVIN